MLDQTASIKDACFHFQKALSFHSLSLYSVSEEYHLLVQNLYYHIYSDYLHLCFSTLDFFIWTVHLALTYKYSAL